MKDSDHRFSGSSILTGEPRRRDSSSVRRFSIVAPPQDILITDSTNTAFRKRLFEGSKCRYPMYCLPIDEVDFFLHSLPNSLKQTRSDKVMKMESMVDHQTLLHEGKLVKVDDDEDRPVVFLSHQWVSFDGADPEFEQFKIFQEAVQSIRDGCKIDYSAVAKGTGTERADEDVDLTTVLDNCLVWYDCTSICQPTSKFAQGKMEETVENLSRAVESIPYYVGKSARFVVLSPPTRHLDTDKICDLMVYRRRGWCRLEMAAWNLLSGGQPTVVMSSGESIMKMPITSVLSAPRLGMGEFTCCNRFENHMTEDESGNKIQIQCDKEKIAPILTGLVSRAAECYKAVGNRQMHRLMKALWRVPLEGVPGVGSKFDSQSISWGAFCREFDLNEKYPVQYSKKQLRGLRCVQPLVYAVCSLNVRMVKYILDHGAKVNAAAGIDLSGLNICMSCCGWTVLHFAALSCVSQYQNESAAILKLLIDARGNPYKFGKAGFSPIAISIMAHNDFFVHWIIDHYTGFHVDKGVTIFDHTMVCYACCVGNFDLIRKLVALRADIHIPTAMGLHPIDNMCMSSSGFDFCHQTDPVTILKWLLDQNVMSNVNDVFRRKPRVSFVSLAMRFVMALCRVQYRWHGGGSRAKERMPYLNWVLALTKGLGPLHITAFNAGCVELLEFLIESKADVHAKTAVGTTPLDHAIFAQNHVHVRAKVKTISNI